MLNEWICRTGSLFKTGHASYNSFKGMHTTRFLMLMNSGSILLFQTCKNNCSFCVRHETKRSICNILSTDKSVKFFLWRLSSQHVPFFAFLVLWRLFFLVWVMLCCLYCAGLLSCVLTKLCWNKSQCKESRALLFVCAPPFVSFSPSSSLRDK